MPLLLILLFIVVPLAELYVILQVGDAIGVVPTILLLAVDSLVGSLLLRSQGRAVWRQFNQALAEGRVPHREVLDGVAVIFGGAFLITPGFLTDIFGLLLLLPPTRSLLRRFATRRIGKRFSLLTSIGRVGNARRPTAGDGPVEGTARERHDEMRRIEP
jgi:UPF0716 protein FxsA